MQAAIRLTHRVDPEKFAAYGQLMHLGRTAQYGSKDRVPVMMRYGVIVRTAVCPVNSYRFRRSAKGKFRGQPLG